ncbi:MAG: hypothetical protein WBD28_06995, partial [Candidatus Zixiibacteriota bacterium]
MKRAVIFRIDNQAAYDESQSDAGIDEKIGGESAKKAPAQIGDLAHGSSEEEVVDLDGEIPGYST